MIYLLVKRFDNSEDYEDQNIFASLSKSVIEDMIPKLKARDLILKNISSSYEELRSDIMKSHPNPPYPDLKSLPPRPLVWDGRQHQNQYMVEYGEAYIKKLAALGKDLDKLNLWFAEQHSLSKDEMMDVLCSTPFEKIEYLIEEVESD